MLTREQQNKFVSKLIEASDKPNCDDLLVKYITNAYLQFPNERPLLRGLVDEFSGFHDTNDIRLRKIYRDADQKSMFVEKIMTLTNGFPHGVELEGVGGIFAIVLKDASHKGKYRYQVFDERGFLSHHTENTWEDVLKDAFLSGFKKQVYGALDQFASNPGFLAPFHPSSNKEL